MKSYCKEMIYRKTISSFILWFSSLKVIFVPKCILWEMFWLYCVLSHLTLGAGSSRMLHVAFWVAATTNLQWTVLRVTLWVCGKLLLAPLSALSYPCLSPWGESLGFHPWWGLSPWRGVSVRPMEHGHDSEPISSIPTYLSTISDNFVIKIGGSPRWVSSWIPKQMNWRCSYV